MVNASASVWYARVTTVSRGEYPSLSAIVRHRADRPTRESTRPWRPARRTGPTGRRHGPARRPASRCCAPPPRRTTRPRRGRFGRSACRFERRRGGRSPGRVCTPRSRRPTHSRRSPRFRRQRPSRRASPDRRSRRRAGRNRPPRAGRFRPARPGRRSGRRTSPESLSEPLSLRLRRRSPARAPKQSPTTPRTAGSRRTRPRGTCTPTPGHATGSRRASAGQRGPRVVPVRPYVHQRAVRVERHRLHAARVERHRFGDGCQLPIPTECSSVTPVGRSHSGHVERCHERGVIRQSAPTAAPERVPRCRRLFPPIDPSGRSDETPTVRPESVLPSGRRRPWSPPARSPRTVLPPPADPVLRPVCCPPADTPPTASRRDCDRNTASQSANRGVRFIRRLVLRVEVLHVERRQSFPPLVSETRRVVTKPDRVVRRRPTSARRGRTVGRSVSGTHVTREGDDGISW